MRKLIILIAIMILPLFLSACSKKTTFIVGYFYPEGAGSNAFVESNPMYSLDECMKWLNLQKNQYAEAGYESVSFDYECMDGCRLGDDYNQGTTYTCGKSIY